MVMQMGNVCERWETVGMKDRDMGRVMWGKLMMVSVVIGSVGMKGGDMVIFILRFHAWSCLA